MIYVFPIIVPANTLASAKQKTILPLSRSKIIGMMVQFPSGQVGLAHLALNVGLHQLFPTNPEASFASSAETVSWLEDYVLDIGSNQMEAYTWNLDTVYDHTITVRVVCESLPDTTGLLNTLKQLLGGT